MLRANEGPPMQHEIDANGRTRTYTLVEPRAAHGRRDLVLVFHGSRQDGRRHRRFTGGAFDVLATRDGAVVAYLDGHRGNWNDARPESRFPARLDGIDDVAFTRAVIDRLVATHAVDPRRVFAVGYSNGGQMVMRLMHETPVAIAGAAVVAATLPEPGGLLLSSPGPATPMPVVLVHGTRDPIAPYTGGPMARWARALFKVRGTSLSAPETASYFARRNRIEVPPPRARAPAATPGRPRTWVERTEHQQDGRPSVVLYTVHGGGHTVPGPARAPRVLGRTTSDISTADVMGWAFGITTPTSVA